MSAPCLKTPVRPIIPVLNLRDAAAGAKRGQFVAALRDALHGVGFLYLEGHGIDAAQEARILATAQAFFGLPQDQKLALHMAGSPHFRGYTAAGDEITRGQRDWREQFDLGAERRPLAGTDPQHAWRRLQGPNQWPPDFPAFRAVALGWQDALTAVGFKLLAALALALGQPADRFDALFKPDPVQHLKLIRYPGQPDAEAAQGVGSHKDSGFLTLLLQDSHAGLQVLTEDRWIDVPPRPHSLVVNVGEALELLTGGYLRATIHRVVSPPPGAERLSVGFFLGPRLDAELLPLVLPPQLARQARGVAEDPQNPLIGHAGKNFLKGRLRSHPEVARRFYADVASA
jgi:isopenicillin N synthase-like dioxygenase